MEPSPPAGSPHGGGTPPPPPPRPFSRSAFPAAAAGGPDVGICGKTWVTLSQWWLAPVEGDDQKIAVAGIYERKRTLHELSPALIAKRHSRNVIESEDGTIFFISGNLNKSRTLGYGYSNMVCEHFKFGFPDQWRCPILPYPNLMNSDTGCQPCSSNISKSRVDSTQFFFEKVELGKRHSSMLNFRDSLINSSCNDSDTATNENAAASTEAGKGGQRTPVVTLEVQGCREETQHMALTEKAAVDEEMAISVYLDVQNSFSLSNGTPILEEYTCDGDIPTNEDAAASNDDNEMYTAPSKEVNNVENQDIASNKKPVGRPKRQISSHEKCQSATGSPGTRNPASYVPWSPLTRCKAKSLSMSTPEGLKLKRTRSGRVIVPTLVRGRQSIVYGKDGWISGITGLDSPAMPKGSEKTYQRRKKRTE